MVAKRNLNKETVVVGMSGGVDSSVAAHMLKEQGYNVVGVFMKNWNEITDTGCCSAAKDFEDVKRVCETIGIPYYSIDFSNEYMERVFAHFIDGLKRGITPNPDILCNREIKFGPFLDFADKIGADFVATGHYCRVKSGQLLRAIDQTKDQSYFLCGLKPEQTSRVMFPLGEMLKTDVRKIAKKLGLITAEKKDSTGICFIGERKFRDFMHQYMGDKPGDIKNLGGAVVGKHNGLAYYTIGQRKGMGIGGQNENTSRWFVVRKCLETNTLYVNNGDCPELYCKKFVAHNFNWLLKPENFPFECTCKTRYRQGDVPCKVVPVMGDFSTVEIHTEVLLRAVTPGQWVVLYDGDVVLGGGEITRVLH